MRGILLAAALATAVQPQVTVKLTQQQLLLIVQGLQGLPYREAAPLLDILQHGIQPQIVPAHPKGAK
jgi:hypothetical protein